MQAEGSNLKVKGQMPYWSGASKWKRSTEYFLSEQQKYFKTVKAVADFPTRMEAPLGE